MEQDVHHDPNTSSTFLTHWLPVFLERKVTSFGVTFPPHYFPSGISPCRNTVPRAAFAETSLFLPCLQFALAHSVPTGTAKGWKWGRQQGGVAHAFCFETAQAEVHQQKHSWPGLKASQAVALLHRCRTSPGKNGVLQFKEAVLLSIYQCNHFTAVSRHQLESTQCSHSWLPLAQPHPPRALPHCIIFTVFFF